jgi:hypothetical protein
MNKDTRISEDCIEILKKAGDFLDKVLDIQNKIIACVDELKISIDKIKKEKNEEGKDMLCAEPGCTRTRGLIMNCTLAFLHPKLGRHYKVFCKECYDKIKNKESEFFCTCVNKKYDNISMEAIDKRSIHCVVCGRRKKDKD